MVELGCGTGLVTREFVKHGYKMIGVEPARAMLHVARHRPECKDVTWIEGGSEKLADFGADLLIMPGHIAQFFLDDNDWRAALEDIHGTLKSGGHVAFESRNPLAPLFANWPTPASHRQLDDPVVGAIEWWSEQPEMKDGRASYEIHYLLAESGEELVSSNELRFRTRAEIEHSLIQMGFDIEHVYGDWDWSAAGDKSPEMIFVAMRK